MAVGLAQKDKEKSQRLRLRIRGAVQGVGFRPFVHHLAETHGLVGFVLNDGDGVLVEVQGAETQAFATALRFSAPPLAVIDSITATPLAVQSDQSGFQILASDQNVVQGTRIPADAAMCEACAEDLFNPKSRFYHYPFVTCTHCGPRYTITRALPYDRPQTSLSGFPFCPDCAGDYADPRNRRYHAEALACPQCGPRLSHSVAEIMAVIDGGGIVAVKGIGGFHLMADATNEAAVNLLRKRKNRDSKPFAVMVANAASVELVAEATALELGLLLSRARPIVVMRSKARVAPSVSPRLSAIGVMLPYAPLHHLMMNSGRDEAQRDHLNARILVATSANLAGEPLITDDSEASAKLSEIADLVVTHDRPIVIRADDSVVAAAAGKTVFIRRARGYAPDPIDLGSDGPSVLALGAHLKTTITLTRGREAFVSQHVGSLNNAATIGFYEETLAHLQALTGAKPQAVACDRHPDFFTTRVAESLGLPVIRVQHHAAHVAVAVAENHLTQALGLALDGHGFGDDGGAWGGEALVMTGQGCARIGHLAPLGLPGGDKAARQPWRMGLAALQALGRLDQLGRLPSISRDLARLMPGLSMPMTTSLGRMFDAAAALLGVCHDQSYEGQAAMELESLVRTPKALAGAYEIRDGVLDLLPLLGALADPAMDPQSGAEFFHGTLALALADWVVALRRSHPDLPPQIALGGGCLMNRVLAETVSARLAERGLVAITPTQVPANDGGVSFGQAHLARQRIMGEK